MELYLKNDEEISINIKKRNGYRKAYYTRLSRRNHNVLTIRSNNRHMASPNTTDAHDATSGDLWLLSFIDNRFAARSRIYTRTSPVNTHFRYQSKVSRTRADKPRALWESKINEFERGFNDEIISTVDKLLISWKKQVLIPWKKHWKNYGSVIIFIYFINIY